jgi:adhesin HecA-like repeat protein
MDEDDPDRGAGATQIDADVDATNDEDGDPTNDANGTLVIRATGYASDNTSVVLEALISPLELPAIVANGDLTISGNPTVDGTAGDVHANSDLTISGNAASISGDATASGTMDCDDPCSQVDGMATGGNPQIPIPTVRASDHFFKADFVLTSSGTMTDRDGNVLCAASPCNFWNFNAGSWTLSGNDATNGTYYVEGSVLISGNAGTALAPVAISLIAEGSIEISGNPDLMPDYPELLFVTDGDLKISGGIDTPLTAQGQMLVREQVAISGNPQITGQLIVENAPSVSSLVTANTISGNPTITYNGGLGTAVYAVTSWRDVR